jgi:hypothetical protein
MQTEEENLKQELMFKKQNMELYEKTADKNAEIERSMLKDQYAFKKEQLSQEGHLHRTRQ